MVWRGLFRGGHVIEYVDSRVLWGTHEPHCACSRPRLTSGNPDLAVLRQMVGNDVYFRERSEEGLCWQLPVLIWIKRCKQYWKFFRLKTSHVLFFFSLIPTPYQYKFLPIWSVYVVAVAREQRKGDLLMEKKKPRVDAGSNMACTGSLWVQYAFFTKEVACK